MGYLNKKRIVTLLGVGVLIVLALPKIIPLGGTNSPGHSPSPTDAGSRRMLLL